MLSSANTIITESKGCKRPNDSRVRIPPYSEGEHSDASYVTNVFCFQELGPKYKCSRLSGPVSCISLNSEWKSLLSFLSHKDVNTLLNETRFWDNVSRKIEVKSHFYYLLKFKHVLIPKYTTCRFQPTKPEMSLKRNFTPRLYPPEMMKTGLHYPS